MGEHAYLAAIAILALAVGAIAIALARPEAGAIVVGNLIAGVTAPR